MTEPEIAPELAPEPAAVIQDIVQQLGIKRDCLDILPLALTDWPDALNIYYVVRKDRHGRIFYHYVCYEGELYSPFAPDGLERLLKRLLASRRFQLNAEQLVNLLLIYNRPEPFTTFITDFNRELSPETREALEKYYGITDLVPQFTVLDDDRKLVFWTLNVRREILKRWTAYIASNGRHRISEDVMIELRNAREGYA